MLHVARMGQESNLLCRFPDNPFGCALETPSPLRATHPYKKAAAKPTEYNYIISTKPPYLRTLSFVDAATTAVIAVVGAPFAIL